MTENAISIKSEIGVLKKVLLHEPGLELENLMPENIERLLFDDIPYLKIAREEHNAFADTLRSKNVEVVYLVDLVVGALTDNKVKEEFIKEYISEAGILSDYRKEKLFEYFSNMTTKNMVLKMMSGIRKTEIKGYRKRNLTDYLDRDYPFLIDPMPNLYFTRDPFACIGQGVSIHKMFTKTRNRETLFAKYIFNHNPEYKDVPVLFDRTNIPSVEGGDVLVLNEKVLAIGISQRTNPHAIEIIAKNIFSHNNTTFEKVLAIDIPKSRSFMHLDTVFTMVDYDKFTIHPNITGNIKVFVLEKTDSEQISIIEENAPLEEILQEHLHLDKVTLIKCGGGNVIDAAREQWNDGSNTFAIAPGKVITYSRNYVTNKVLEEYGIEVLAIPSSELSRGRGGPRCMTMPLVREKL